MVVPDNLIQMKPEIRFLTKGTENEQAQLFMRSRKANPQPVDQSSQDAHINPHLVVLQIPTLDLLILPAREQVRASTADRHTTHRADVSSQGEFQFPTG